MHNSVLIATISSACAFYAGVSMFTGTAAPQAEQRVDADPVADISQISLDIATERLKTEVQWGQFLDWQYNVYLRSSPDKKAFEAWKEHWHEQTNQVFFHAEMIRSDLQMTDDPDYSEEFKHKLLAESLSKLEEIRERRIRLTRGILTDVYGLPKDSPRLEAWD